MIIETENNTFSGIQEATARGADNERSGITEYYKGPTGRIFVSTGCHPSNFEYFDVAVDLMRKSI